MTLHNITTQAHAANRDLAAAERAAVVAFLRRKADEAEADAETFTAPLLRLAHRNAATALRHAADHLEAGDHRR